MASSVYIHSILIVFSSFMLYFISFGIVQSFGVVYIELLQYFGSTKSATSWIPSLGSGLLLCLGPVGGAIEERYGCRFLSILSSILITGGLIASVFVENMYLLYLTYGIITGTGFSLAHIAANVSVNIYFDKRRSFACGVSSAGSGVCTMILPILGTYLLEEYGWRGTFLIYAGIGMQGIYCGILFGSLGSHSRLNHKVQNLDIIPETVIYTVEAANGTVVNTPQTSHEPHQLSIRQKMSRIFCKKFILYNISCTSVALVYFSTYLMLPDLVINLGISQTNAALMITVAGISSITSRIIFGYISDFPFINRPIVNGLLLIILGVSTILVEQFKNLTFFFIYSSIVGTTTGVFGMYSSIITMDIVGPELIGLAFGFLTMFSGIAVTAGTPLAGYITDVTGSYTITFIYMGILFTIGGLFSIILSYNLCSKTKKVIAEKS